MTRECAVEGCRNITMLAKCNTHSSKTLKGGKIKESYLDKLEKRSRKNEKIEKKYGFLAETFSITCVAFLKTFYSIGVAISDFFKSWVL